MTEKQQKFRSPPYPAISLEKAIQRAKDLRDVAKGYPVPLTSAAKAWKFSEKSSATTTVAAALNQYGLIVDEGAKQNRRIRVSDLGERIIMDVRPHSIDRENAIREAALSPTIFKEIWDQYRTAEVDSHTLIYELTLGRKNSGLAPFSESAANDVAKLYQETLTFAGVSAEDTKQFTEKATISEWDEPLDRTIGASSSPTHTDADEPPQIYTPQLEPNQFKEQKALDEGEAILIWPKELSTDSVEDMEYWLTGVLKQIRRRAGKAKEE